MGWKVWIKDYLSFTRKDRIGLIVIALILAGLLFLPSLIFKNGSPPVPITDTAWLTAIEKFEAADPPTRQNSGYSAPGYIHKSWKTEREIQLATPLFTFDPNTLAPEEWQRLGLRPKTITTILNYRAKGGRFRQPADLQRVYGLHEDEYRRLLPFIKIVNTSLPVVSPPRANDQELRYPASVVNHKREPIDLNAADTTLLIRLPGIGAKLSLRILNFRDKLGGFYSSDQLREVYGLTDSTFQLVKPLVIVNPSAIRKINLNTATIDELKAHPYVRYTLANPIVSYRTEHGNFRELRDLLNVMAVTPDVFARLLPYFSL